MPEIRANKAVQYLKELFGGGGWASKEDWMNQAVSSYEKVMPRAAFLEGASPTWAEHGKANLDLMKRYLWSDATGAQRAARIGALGAKMNLVDGTLRHITGNGGYFHDSDGNFDIAGVPFI